MTETRRKSERSAILLNKRGNGIQQRRRLGQFVAHLGNRSPVRCRSHFDRHSAELFKHPCKPGKLLPDEILWLDHGHHMRGQAAIVQTQLCEVTRD